MSRHQRLRALETKYNKCTYGYQMAGIRKKSKHGTSRCWLNDDPEQYKSAND
jgi:hypothetical protein